MGQRLQPLQRQRQMRATFVVGDGVDFVHDHGFNVAQDCTALVGSEQDVERLRRGHQNVGRPLQHRAALGHERVAGADRSPNLRHEQPALARHGENFTQRGFQVFLNIVAQGLQRRDVENLGAISQLATQRLAHQTIDAGKKRGQGLAGAGGSRDKGRPARQDVGPALFLGFSRSAKPAHEPLRH